jgi:NADH-quinone oxidoreductase subunit H
MIGLNSILALDWVLLTDKLILIGILFAVSLGIAAYSTLAERKIAAYMQDRIGPDRAGFKGMLQPIADGVKSILKEEIIPTKAHKFLFILGPCIFMTVALMTYAIIPWGKDLMINGRPFQLQLVDLNVGILYSFGVVSLGVYGIMIGGWASNNKFSLLGAVRASTQMISYELAMGLSLIAIVMMTGSLSLRDITDAQGGWHGMKWNIIFQPLAFIIFFTCSLAETNRTPFDLAETESELIGGYHTEYSSMKLALYLFGEYVNIFVSAAIISILFFGGYNFPYMDKVSDPNLLSVLSIVALFAKIFFFIFVFMWVRWTIPRFRYDQLMKLGWQIFIPLCIVNILVTGLVITLVK